MPYWVLDLLIMFIVVQFVHHFLRLLWHFLHLLVSLWYLQVSLVETTESYLISTGLLKDYKALDISNVRYLAIVIDSEDARQISKVLQLLKWLAAVGVKHLCLYDSIGTEPGYSWKRATSEVLFFYYCCHHIGITLMSKIVCFQLLFSSRSSQDIQANHHREIEKCCAIWGSIFYLYDMFSFIQFSTIHVQNLCLHSEAAWMACDFE